MTAAIFWLKTRGGWRETPQSHQLAVTDLSQISDADLDRIIAMLETAVAAEAPATRSDR